MTAHPPYMLLGVHREEWPQDFPQYVLVVVREETDEDSEEAADPRMVFYRCPGAVRGCFGAPGARDGQ
eukprot:36094-Eustigmatos_ZCMA.PRE.1